MKNLILNIIKILASILKYSSLKLTKTLQKLENNLTLDVDTRSYDTEARMMVYRLINSELLDSKIAIRRLYNTLMKDTDFLNFGKTKAIIVTAVTDDGECGFHHNVLIENDTTFEQYYESIEDRLVTLYEDGYKIDVIPQFKVRVWNLDHVKNSNIKITRNATTKK